MSPERNHWIDRLPWALLLTAAAIIAIAAINLASAAGATRPNLWAVQLVWISGAAALAAVVVRMKPFLLEVLIYPSYAFVCGLLVLVLVAGTKVKGAQRWLDLGVFNLQPSELAKVAIILVTARYFANYEQRDGYTLRGLLFPMNLSRPLIGIAFFIRRWVGQNADFSSGVKDVSVDPLWLKGVCLSLLIGWAVASLVVLKNEGFHHRRLVAPADVILIPFVLVVIEPDLGTSLIVVAIAGVQVLFRGMNRVSLAIATVTMALAIVFGWNFFLKDYQKQRVETFLNPENDIRGAGYHSAQSKIAIGSGGLTGKGRGAGTQTQLSFLPENHTDFAFAVWAEEWGFLGSSILVLLFMALVLLMAREGQECTDPFQALLCVGAAAMVFWHVLINIGMVTGLLPVVGVTLPIMSYGGSSALTQMFALALCVHTAVWRRA